MYHPMIFHEHDESLSDKGDLAGVLGDVNENITSPLSREEGNAPPKIVQRTVEDDDHPEQFVHGAP